MIDESSGLAVTECSRSVSPEHRIDGRRALQMTLARRFLNDRRVQGKLKFRPCRNARLSEEGDVDTVSGSSLPRALKFWPTIQMFLYLQILDVLTTLIGLRIGCAEANPLISHLMQFGP